MTMLWEPQVAGLSLASLTDDETIAQLARAVKVHVLSFYGTLVQLGRDTSFRVMQVWVRIP